MYVLFPAEEIVEFTLSRVTHTNLQQQNASPTNVIGAQQEQYQQFQIDYQTYKQQREDDLLSRAALAADRSTKTKSKKSKAGSRAPAPAGPKMASSSNEVTLRDLQHPALNDALKNHNAVTFKLVRTVSDFTQQLSQIYGQHAEELQLLVSNFRKRNSELRKERPNCPSSLFHTWETLLQEVEIDSQTHGDVSVILTRQVSRPLLERSFHRKIQSRKVFAHRESFEAMLNKQEDALSKSRQEYKSAYLSFISSPGASDLRSAYLDTHNAYVQNLTMTNAMLEQYHQEALPQLLQELEEIYSDLCSTMSEAVLQGAEIVSSRAIEQSRRYDSLTSQCRAVLSASDLAHFVRSVSIPHSYPHRPALRHNFVTPQPAPPDPSDPPDPHAQDPPPASTLKNELVVDRMASLSVRTRYDSLKKEAGELDAQIRQLHDALDTLLRIQQRSLESNLYNKANELQEDISVKRFDLRATQIRLNGINAQKELFATKVEGSSEQPHDRKMSSSSQGSMKTKWLKAFKSLKTTPSNGSSTKEPEKKNGRSESGNGASGESVAHSFQEYTYKKITPCDVCSQVLRGHTRQGMRCRVCKLNVHLDCQEKAPRCQQKSRLLRRQKSTSEIDTRLQEQPGLEDEKPSSPGSACGTRPFGQPLCLSEVSVAVDNGSVRSQRKSSRFSK